MISPLQQSDGQGRGAALHVREAFLSQIRQRRYRAPALVQAGRMADRMSGDAHIPSRERMKRDSAGRLDPLFRAQTRHFQGTTPVANGTGKEMCLPPYPLTILSWTFMPALFVLRDEEGRARCRPGPSHLTASIVQNRISSGADAQRIVRSSAHFSYPTMILRQTGVFCCRSETNSPIKAKSHANMSSDDP